MTSWRLAATVMVSGEADLVCFRCAAVLQPDAAVGYKKILVYVAWNGGDKCI